MVNGDYFGDLHLKTEHWSTKNHSHMEFIKIYGGWVSMKNSPLEYWKQSFFGTIGQI